MHQWCCTCCDRAALASFFSMLSLWKLRVGSEAYYLSQVASGLEDYYSGRGEVPGAWVGNAADALGLAGEVAGEDLQALVAGLAPRTGLTPNGGTLRAAARRVPGFDLTFSVPKSVSVIYALGDPLVHAEVVRGGRGGSHGQSIDLVEREACLSGGVPTTGRAAGRTARCVGNAASCRASASSQPGSGIGRVGPVIRSCTGMCS